MLPSSDKTTFHLKKETLCFRNVLGYILSILMTTEQVILNPAANITHVQALSKPCIVRR